MQLDEWRFKQQRTEAFWLYYNLTSLCNWPTGNRNRHHALRLHVTNASFKEWVGILLKPNIDWTHLTSEIWEETHLKELFYGTLIFQQNNMICIVFVWLYSCLPTWRPKQCPRSDVLLTLPHHVFNISLKLKCKICVQKEVIDNLKKSHFGQVGSNEHIHFKKMVRVRKTKSLLFYLRYDPLIIVRG